MCPTQLFTAPIAGTYLFTVAGAQGGTPAGGTFDPPGSPGGLGATVTATVFLQRGATVPIIVAGQGATGDPFFSQEGAGGGGLSAVYTDGGNIPTIVAGPAPTASCCNEHRCSCQIMLYHDIQSGNHRTVCRALESSPALRAAALSKQGSQADICCRRRGWWWRPHCSRTGIHPMRCAKRSGNRRCSWWSRRITGHRRAGRCEASCLSLLRLWLRL